MPTNTLVARILLFVAGVLWSLLAVMMLVLATVAGESGDDVPLADAFGNMMAGMAVVMFVLCGGMGALHIVPAALFGRGSTGTMVTGVIAGCLNGLFGLFPLLSGEAGGMLLGLLWFATAVLTVVFSLLPDSRAWFARPRQQAW